MSLIDYFKARKKSSASVAKERLQIIVSHERTKRNQPDYLLTRRVYFRVTVG